MAQEQDNSMEEQENISVQEQIDGLKHQIQLLQSDVYDKDEKPPEYVLRRKSIDNSQELDFRYRYVHVRSFASDEELKRGSESQSSRWNHVRPDSILVCGMGFHWSSEGFAWNKVCNMIEYTQSLGYYVGFSEIQDRCFNPYDALGTMRNEAILMAQNEGFEWLCYVDNDVLPEPDALVRLVQRQYPIISPYVVEPGTGRSLYAPTLSPNSGVHPAKWTVLSMLLFRTSVFNCTGPYFWRDAVGADEGFHFQTLWHYGHRPWIDTDIQLVISGAPHYPLSTNRLTSSERAELWDVVNDKRNGPPDRRPMDPNGPNVVDGEYMPWVPPGHKNEEQVQVDTMPSAPDDDMVSLSETMGNDEKESTEEE